MDNKKIKLIISILSVVFILSSIMAAYTFASNIATINGTVKTQGVDISITADADDSEVTPNKFVRYEPKIHYQGVDSWIRLKLDISNENIKEEYFKGLDDNWIKEGEYMYYTKVVSHGDEIKTFDGFKIPSEWDEKEPENLMESKFKVITLCDAVQARNFTPDFDSKNPWGELEIEDSQYDGSTYVESENIIKPIDLKFVGAGQYTLSSNEIILDTLPADIYKNDINIYNEGKHDTEVFFYVSDMDIKDKSLLDVIKLKLSIDGNVFYDGTLRAEELIKQRSLIKMKPNEKHILSYEITVPSELKDEYQGKLDNFAWNFTSVEHINPSTGDKAKFAIYFILVVVSLVLIVLLKRKVRKDK